jgi:aminoglycoside phosphotransferase (APT) family kinase protein
MVSPTLIDIEQPDHLTTYLRERGVLRMGENVNSHVLSGGVSNKTVWIDLPNGESWVVKQALAKLRVKVDWFSDPARLKREALGMALIDEIIPGACPILMFYDDKNYILAMNAVPLPHENWKTQLLTGNLYAEHVETYARYLAAIHRGTYHRAAELMPDFGDRTFFEALRLEAYYAYTGEQVAEAHEFVQALINETRTLKIALTHGDYSPKNVLLVMENGAPLRDARLVLLDHETCHIGDPAFDIGFSMTHFLSKALHLPNLRGDFTRAALTYWQVYQTNFELAQSLDYEARATRHLCACLLARVAGRSPLEYLDETERARQRHAVIALIAEPPATISDLITRFERSLNADD